MIWYVHVLYKTLPPEGIPNPMGPCIPFTTPLDHFHPNALSQHITDLTCTFMSHFFSFYHIKSPLIPINYNDMSIYPFITFQFLKPFTDKLQISNPIFKTHGYIMKYGD